MAPIHVLTDLSVIIHYVIAIDIAVQRGFNAFAEHLNNLLFEVDADRDGSDEEKNDRSASVLSNNGYSRESVHQDSEVDDDAYDSGNSLADSNELSECSTRTVASRPESSFGEGTVSTDDIVNEVMVNSMASVCRLDGGTNSDALLNQLYQAKYALNELVKENEILKSKLAIYCGDVIESSLAKKSVSELNSLEDEVRRSLDRIIKAKEVASSNLEDARMCVICKENPKSVLFMNCRHLCVCNECGHLDILVQCPLCRMEIREKINVYA